MPAHYLYDSRGIHIANVVTGQLHSVTGHNIGHPAPSGKFFMDMQGRYLGEVVHGNRFLDNLHSPYQGVNYGAYGDYGFVGDYGNPGDIGSMQLSFGYRDVPREKLGFKPKTAGRRR